MTFLPPRPPFLQDFCKKAQWRAKKLRERGSNTARPTEKGGGGIPIGARPVNFGASRRSVPVNFGASCRSVPVGRVASCRFGRFRRDLACWSRRVGRCRSVASFRADSVGFGRADLDCCLCRVASIRSRRVGAGRFRRVASCRSMATDTDTDNEGKTQKAQFLNQRIGLQRSQGVAGS